MTNCFIALFIYFIFIKSAISQEVNNENLYEASQNIKYEIPSDDPNAIVFKGTGILTASDAKAAQNKKKIIIEEGITEIEDMAFYQSPNLRSDEEFDYEAIELPCSLVKIGYLAFKTQSHNLKKVHFTEYQSENASETNLEAFYSLREIGDYAFSGQDLSDHNIPPTFTSIGTNAFEFCSFSHIQLNSKLNSIPNYAFLHCKSLLDIVIPSSVTSIGTSSFENCKSLRNVNWSSEKVTHFGYNAFYGCVSLEEFVFPERGSGFYESGFFFENCIKLKRCVLPKQIEDGNLGRGAFMNCVSLTEVVLPQNAVSIPYDFFRNTSITTAYLPETVNEIHKNALRDCKNLKFVHVTNKGMIKLDSNVFVGSDNIQVAVIEGNVTLIDEKSLKAKVLCYNGILNPKIEDGSFDTGNTNVFVRKEFEDKNGQVKFGNWTEFDGYGYKLQDADTCAFKENDENDGNKDSNNNLSALEIAAIVLGSIAIVGIIAAVVIVIINVKKKNQDRTKIDDSLID